MAKKKAIKMDKIMSVIRKISLSSPENTIQAPEAEHYQYDDGILPRSQSLALNNFYDPRGCQDNFYDPRGCQDYHMAAPLATNVADSGYYFAAAQEAIPDPSGFQGYLMQNPLATNPADCGTYFGAAQEAILDPSEYQGYLMEPPLVTNATGNGTCDNTYFAAAYEAIPNPCTYFAAAHEAIPNPCGYQGYLFEAPLATNATGSGTCDNTYFAADLLPSMTSDEKEDFRKLPKDESQIEVVVKKVNQGILFSILFTYVIIR